MIPADSLDAQNFYVLGLDCAAQPERSGIALARVESSQIEWLDARQGRKGESIAKLCAGLLEHHGFPRCGSSLRDGCQPELIVALDAPLGWPAPLAHALSDHQAGEPLRPDSNTLFRRRTDKVVQRILGKRPLEVGADRIARAAVTALLVLDELRAELGLVLPVAIDQPDGATSGGRSTRSGDRACCGVSLEVYPAALLIQAGLPSRLYKRSEQRATRAVILEGLVQVVPEARGLPTQITETALAHADAMDALLCVVTGWLYREGRCIGPEVEVAPAGLNIIRREGWIWLPERLM